MPGKLLEVRVAPGQAVAADEIVAVMEAMKIEISLAAPFAGTVSAIHSEPGTLVGSRQEIVTVEAGDGPPASD
jgi:biotin carboxyl carrier protein